MILTMKRVLAVSFVAILVLVGGVFIPATLAQQTSSDTAVTASVPAVDQPTGEWMLANGEQVTLEMRAVVEGPVSGVYCTKDEADGAIDCHPISGVFRGRELRLSVNGTGHPGYILEWKTPDVLDGYVVGIPDEKRTFLRRLPFTGENPA